MSEGYNFEDIPLFTDTPGSFALMLDDISGRIPVTRLQHWNDFSELLDSAFFRAPGFEYVYRGHRRFDWKLQPTLGRIAHNGVIDAELANRHLRSFRQAIRGRVSDYELVREHEEDELWAVGQHHGLMTPLLDWTYSPFVALFFAFSAKDAPGELDNPYRSVYLLNKAALEDQACPDIPLVEPVKDDYGRLVNQAGLFTKSPYGDSFENVLINWLAESEDSNSELGRVDENDQASVLARYICKVYIPNTDQNECVRFLRRMNVHHASLFPDLIGAAQHCNTLAYEQGESSVSESYETSDTSLVAGSSPEPKRPKFTLADLAYVGVGRRSMPDTAELAIILQRYSRNLVSSDVIKTLADRVREIYIDELVNVVDVRDAEKARFRVRGRKVLQRYSYPLEGAMEALSAILGEEYGV